MVGHNTRLYKRGGKRTARKGKVPTSTASLSKMIKSVSLKQVETKIASQYEENNQLLHNRTFYKGNLMFTALGSGDGQGFADSNRCRLGDEIIARGCKLKFWLSTKVDRPNVMYNIYLFTYNTLDVPTDSTFWRGTDGVGGTMNRMIDAPNPQRIRVLKKFLLKPTSQLGNLADGIGADGRENSLYREAYFSFNNKKIRYRQDNAGVPAGQDLGIAVVAYDAFGTLPTDNIASFAWSSTFYYKDP